MTVLQDLHWHLVQRTDGKAILDQFHSRILRIDYEIDRIGTGNSLPCSVSLAANQPNIHNNVLFYLGAA